MSSLTAANVHLITLTLTKEVISASDAIYQNTGTTQEVPVYLAQLDSFSVNPNRDA